MRDSIYNRLHNEPYPCEFCEYKQKCADELLACRRFLWYINEERWVCERQDEPSEKLFQMVFDPDNEEILQTYLRTVRKKRRDGKDVSE